MQLKMKPYYKSDNWIEDDNLYNSGPGPTGAIYCLSSDTAPTDIIDRLHAVIEEITRKPLPKPAKRKIGFY